MSKKSVLVVDDDKVICFHFSRVLSAAGYEVRTVGNAEAALKTMADNPADVLFLDLQLPDTNGLELCRQIRKDWPASVPIAITGFASVFELMECREAGFDDYFIKPVQEEALRDAAEQGFKKIHRWKKK